MKTLETRQVLIDGQGPFTIDAVTFDAATHTPYVEESADAAALALHKQIEGLKTRRRAALETLNLTDLKALAVEAGLEVKAGQKKPELVDLLIAAEFAPDADAPAA
jgi:hypothetical protein